MLAPEKSVVRWTDRPDMTIAVDWLVKNQTKQSEKTCLQHSCSLISAFIHLLESIYVNLPEEKFQFVNFRDNLGTYSELRFWRAILFRGWFCFLTATIDHLF